MTRMVTPFVPPASQLPLLAPRAGVRKFTVDEYHRLINEGFFATDERLELIEGWIVTKMPRNPPHDVAIDKAQDALRAVLPRQWRVRVQSAVTLADSEPEPDLAVVLNPADRYVDSHPRPADIALLVESSASTLEFDRADKGRVYAKSGIPVYWILNVDEKLVEVYTEPAPASPASPAAYRTQEVFSSGDIVPLIIGGQKVGEIPAADLLP